MAQLHRHSHVHCVTEDRHNSPLNLYLFVLYLHRFTNKMGCVEWMAAWKCETIIQMQMQNASKWIVSFCDGMAWWIPICVVWHSAWHILMWLCDNSGIILEVQIVGLKGLRENEREWREKERKIGSEKEWHIVNLWKMHGIIVCALKLLRVRFMLVSSPPLYCTLIYYMFWSKSKNLKFSHIVFTDSSLIYKISLLRTEDDTIHGAWNTKNC